MSSAYDYDLIVIGGGIAGMVSAVTARGIGKKVAVIEKSKIGGNCTNTTCIPSKALITLAHINQEIKKLIDHHIIEDTHIKLNTSNIMPHIRGIIERAYEKDRPETFKEIGIDLISGQANFIDNHRVDVNGKTISALKFIIASGTIPFIPPVEGLKDIDYLTNETLYQLDDLPDSLIILGGGVDGLEYAYAFGLLGVKTTVVEMSSRLLPMVDLELVNHLLSASKNEGIRILSGAKAVRFFKREERIALLIEHTRDGRSEEIEADRVIVTVGRKPDLEGLNLEKAGVEYNPRGITVDSKLRTTSPNIYACGDIAGPYQLASTAEAQAIIAATNAFLPVKRDVDYKNNVYVIFTNPPIAYLGLTEEQAYEKYSDKLRIYRFDYKNMRRSIIDMKDMGIAKVICDNKGYIVGAHILGEAGPEAIHEIQVLKAMNMPLYKLNETTHAYPTYSQALIGRAGQLAFLDYMKDHPLVKIGLGILPGFSNKLNLAKERLAESGPSEPSVKTLDYKDAFEEYNKTHKKEEIKIEQIEPWGSKICFIKTQEGEDSLKVGLKGYLHGLCEKTLYFISMDAIKSSKRIEIDLSELEKMDMDGAGIIIKCIFLLSEKNLTMVITGLDEKLTGLFHLLRIDEIANLDKTLQKHTQSNNIQNHPTLGWAAPMESLSLKNIPDHVMNINVDGRRPTSPALGYGPLWEKRYRLRIENCPATPKEIVSIWRSNFSQLWPKGNTAITSDNKPIAPGVPAVLNLSLPGGMTLATGIYVVYSDETSFGFLTVEGHMLSGWITFSSFYEGNSVIIQVHPLFRAADPIMELALKLGGAKQEDLFWHRTLKNLARHIGCHGTIEQMNIVVDKRLHWDKKTDIWKNAAIRSSIYMPLYLMKKIFHPKKQ
ncbi:MAG TPA: FAD-dependent oxidoreductase [Syntrophorhabdaceae bacterium]|nr:FAD-dependent oxidoreductase [Syntrophorhabdaceae bacterium]